MIARPQGAPKAKNGLPTGIRSMIYHKSLTTPGCRDRLPFAYELPAWRRGTQLKNLRNTHANIDSATTDGAAGALTRRELMGGSVLGAALLTGGPPLMAQSGQTSG